MTQLFAFITCHTQVDAPSADAVVAAAQRAEDSKAAAAAAAKQEKKDNKQQHEERARTAMGWTGHKKPKAQDYRQWLIDAEVPFPSNTAIEALCELIVQHQPGQHAE